jgi:hypothetical protein
VCGACDFWYPSKFILLELSSPSRRIFIGSHSLPLSGRQSSPSHDDSTWLHLSCCGGDLSATISRRLWGKDNQGCGSWYHIVAQAFIIPRRRDQSLLQIPYRCNCRHLRGRPHDLQYHLAHRLQKIHYSLPEVQAPATIMTSILNHLKKV